MYFVRIDLRLQLLDSTKQIQLLQILNGILTLLPPSNGFNALRIRLHVISIYNKLAKLIGNHKRKYVL